MSEASERLRRELDESDRWSPPEFDAPDVRAVLSELDALREKVRELEDIAQKFYDVCPRAVCFDCRLDALRKERP